MKQSSQKYLHELMERFPELAGTQDAITGIVEAIIAAYNAGGKILICGNGGSAADSEHIVGELMKNFVISRGIPDADVDRFRSSGIADWEYLVNHLQQGIPAIALTGHVALSTAVLNDTDPCMAFAQQVYVYGNPKDLLIALSTSGNAGNVCNAAKVARVKGLVTAALTGSRPCKLDGLCDIVVKAPSEQTYRVQEYHLPIYHCICLMAENEVFGDSGG